MIKETVAIHVFFCNRNFKLGSVSNVFFWYLCLILFAELVTDFKTRQADFWKHGNKGNWWYNQGIKYLKRGSRIQMKKMLSNSHTFFLKFISWNWKAIKIKNFKKSYWGLVSLHSTSPGNSIVRKWYSVICSYQAVSLNANI